jgi:hypothetical protein
MVNGCAAAGFRPLLPTVWGPMRRRPRLGISGRFAHL